MEYCKQNFSMSNSQQLRTIRKVPLCFRANRLRRSVKVLVCCICRTERHALFCVVNGVMPRECALYWRLQIKRDFFVFFEKCNFALSYRFFIFSLHWFLLVLFHISAALNTTTPSEPALCSAALLPVHMYLQYIFTIQHLLCTWHKALFTGNFSNSRWT